MTSLSSTSCRSPALAGPQPALPSQGGVSLQALARPLAQSPFKWTSIATVPIIATPSPSIHLSKCRWRPRALNNATVALGQTVGRDLTDLERPRREGRAIGSWAATPIGWMECRVTKARGPMDTRSVAMVLDFLASGETTPAGWGAPQVQAALVSAGVTLFGSTIGLLGGAWISSRNAAQATTQQIAIEELRAGQARENARLEQLRRASAEFATLAVRQADLAELLVADPAAADVRTHLLRSHTDLRVSFETLRLLARSPAVVARAREVLRAAWNERQEGLGLARNRPRLDPTSPPSKELRNWLLPFLTAVRGELGIEEPLPNDIPD